MKLREFIGNFITDDMEIRCVRALTGFRYNVVRAKDVMYETAVDYDGLLDCRVLEVRPKASCNNATLTISTYLELVIDM